MRFWLKWGSLAFLAFYVLHDPPRAAATLKQVLLLIISAFTQLGRFISALT